MKRPWIAQLVGVLMILTGLALVNPWLLLVALGFSVLGMGLRAEYKGGNS